MTRHARLATASLAAASLAVAACGGKSSSGPDATQPDGPLPDAGFVTAPHTPFPMVLPHAGKIIAHPQLITINYSDYAARTDVEKFGDQIVQSAWLTAVGADYGVGTGTHVGKYQIGAAPKSIDGTGIATAVSAKITDGTLPAIDTASDQIYMIYIPSTVTLGSDLQGELGHHQQATAGGKTYALAVVIDDGSGLDNTTATAAHELIEAATDPYDPPNDGWYIDPPTNDPWWAIAGEVGDLCDGEALIRSGDYAVQRSWSNAAAAAGKNPCVPEDPNDFMMDVTADPATMPTVAAGGMATFTLTGWSTGPTADWPLELFTADYSDIPKANLSPALSGTMINNGKTVTLTLHVPTTATSGQVGAVYVASEQDPAKPYEYRPWAVGFIVK